MNRVVVLALGAAAAAAVGVVLLLGGWLLAAAGGAETGCTTSPLTSGAVPAKLVPLFNGASTRYELGPRGPAILAGLTDVESGFGKNLGPSSAGAMGWTQFMPATWRAFGVDADGDGRRSPMSAADAIYAAARYLQHLGAPNDWRRALFGYNHANWYVEKVISRAGELASGDVLDVAFCAPAGVPAAGGRRVLGGGRIVSIPGMPGESIDERLVRDVAWLVRRFRVKVTDGYATAGHEATGEHPLGLAVDIVPGPTGSWDDVDRLAAWAEPRQGRPRPPFRWVGYNGDADHGRGDHLHLSWSHGPAPGQRPPAPWVEVLIAAGAQ